VLDQMQLAGIDPREAMAGPDAEKLRRREADLRRRLASLEARLQLLPPSGSEIAGVIKDLADSQKEYEEVWREILFATPLYRNLGGAGGDALDFVRERLLKPDSALMLYWVGRERSYVFIIRDKTHPSAVFPLTVPEAAARRLAALKPAGGEEDIPTRGIRIRPIGPEEGPEAIKGPALQLGQARLLVDAYLAQAMNPRFNPTRGIAVREIPGEPASSGSDLEVPARAFLPPAVRKHLAGLKLDHLIVVPDGPLHKLPLEALLLEAGPEPRYGMDELPPLVYSPSLAVLPLLAGRPSRAEGAPSLLSVGAVEYGNRRVIVGGRPARLEALPCTGEESRRVAGLFAKGKVATLRGTAATEKEVVSLLPGRQYLHFATHGLADERPGNLFGSLVFAAPGGGATLNDDGYLRLGEVYRLRLEGCEVAALSACQTNVGPQRPLEAGATLAGGFLAAGARYVVASHWSVDDNSTAELMSSFFEEVLRSREAGKPVSYAKALQQARRRVRERARWAGPFYWAPFVLLGCGE
jgi:hypothetical protein